MKIISIKNKPTTPNNTDFSIWLSEQILKITDNYKNPLMLEESEEWDDSLPLDEEDMEMLLDWDENVNPNLDELNLEQAYKMAKKWKRKQLSSEYKTNDVVYKWKDGWKMVKLPPISNPEHKNDIEIERNLIQNDFRAYQPIMNANYSYIEEKTKLKDDLDIIIYSLRDPENIPRATIELLYSKNKPNELTLTETYTNEKPVPNPDVYDGHFHPRNQYIKDFFNYLKIKQGYYFTPNENEESYEPSILELNEMNLEDQFGIPLNMSKIGGSVDQYYKNIEEAYGTGGDTYWSSSRPFKAIDNLVDYAKKRRELDELEEASQLFTEKAFDWWMQSSDNIEFENPKPDEPEEKDFISPPDVNINQPEFSNMPEAKERFDKEAYENAVKEYEEAMKKYEEEEARYEEDFEPYIFTNHLYQEITKAKEETNLTTLKTSQNNMKTKIAKITKIADKIDDNLPSGEQMALYVLTLKEYHKDNPNINDKWKNLIEQLPSPRKIRQDLSMQEIKILYETVEYLWKNITGNKIIADEKIIKAPESLKGNYWMISKGILLNGINHYDIIKKNTSLICSLLKIGGMTIQEYLASPPNKLIHFIIKNGGIRLFITQDKRFYCQMSPKTYASWGKAKIKKLDFKNKIIKLIDIKAPYSGWKSGIPIKL